LLEINFKNAKKKNVKVLSTNTKYKKKKNEKKSSREEEDGKNSWIRVKNKRKRLTMVVSSIALFFVFTYLQINSKASCE